jgi:RNA polymerase sigma factor (sigma-70 family)
MLGPHRGHVRHIRIVETVNQRVDLGSHHTENPRTLVVNRGERVRSTSRHDVELTRFEYLTDAVIFNGKPPVQNDESLVSDVMYVQRRQVTWVWIQIPLSDHEIDHHANLTVEDGLTSRNAGGIDARHRPDPCKSCERHAMAHLCQPERVVERLSGMTQPMADETLTAGEMDVAGRQKAAQELARADLIDVLFRRHYTSLLRLAVVMVGNREAAEDAVQEAFAALHRNRRSLRDHGAAEAYLRSAVLNRCRSWVRRQATQRAARPLMLVREHHESAEDTIIERDGTGFLVAVMRTLARRQREVLACRFVLELSVAETAQLLKISEGSVKAHTHRGLRALQKRIEVAR